MSSNVSSESLGSNDEVLLTGDTECDSDAGEAQSESHSYGQILKTSALIGGSSIINIGVGMIRTKAMAMMLGPSGFGLMGLYGSILELTQSVVGMGINSSGVRQIAESVGSGDTARIAKTAHVLRRTSIFLGLFGAAFLFGFANRLSITTFGNDSHAYGVALLSIAVFFNLVSAGQGALIQGMRRIADMAKMSIFGAFYGVLISVPVVYFMREDGVVLSIILVSFMTLVTSWWYRRKIEIPSISIATAQVGREQMELLKLGFAFMSSGLMMTGAAYLIRVFIVQEINFEAAGLYQSAWTLGGLYIGLILQAMGADFYPRLTAVVNDHPACNRMVNEQAHVSLLLAGPGVLATLTFAPLAIVLFYSSKFAGAIELLRWLCLGMTLRVISWPMGFIIVAKNAQKLFFFSELAWTCFYLGVAWISVTVFKLNGVGIAFFGSYVFHVLMIYLIVKQLTLFRWSKANIETSFFYLALIGIIFVSFYSLPFYVSIAVGAVATILSCMYSIQVLVELISVDKIPRPVLKLLKLFKLLPKTVVNNERSDSNFSDPTAKKSFVTVKRLIVLFMLFTLISMGVNSRDKFIELVDLLTIENFLKIYYFLGNALTDLM